MKMVELLERVKISFDDAQLNHVQVLMVLYKGHMAIKLASFDNDKVKAKAMAVMANFKESAKMVRETKTTLIYTMEV